MTKEITITDRTKVNPFLATMGITDSTPCDVAVGCNTVSTMYFIDHKLTAIVNHVLATLYTTDKWIITDYR